MLNTLKDFFTLEMIYHFTNIGVIPLWILLAFLPGWSGTKVLINSILVPLILGLTYFYVFYIYINTSEGIFSNILDKGKIFELYLGIDQLKKIFSDKNVLLLFWIHFLTANLIRLSLSKSLEKLSLMSEFHSKSRCQVMKVVTVMKPCSQPSFSVRTM